MSESTAAGDGATWIRVAAASDVPPGGMKGAAVPGTKLVLAIANVDGALYAIDSTCPHREGPLANGRLVAGEVECPWHRFRFDPRTGRGTVPDAYPPVTRYPVRTSGEDVEVLPVPVTDEGTGAAAPAAPVEDAEQPREAAQAEQQLVHGT